MHRRSLDAALRAVVVTTFAFAALSGSTLVGDEPAITFDVIKKAWQARQERTRTVSFEWSEQRVFGKHGSNVFVKAGERVVDGRKVDVFNSQRYPSCDVETSVDRAVARFDDQGRTYLETDSPEVGRDGPPASREPVILAFNGARVQQLMSQPGTRPEGGYVLAPRVDMRCFDDLRPFLLLYRPLDEDQLQMTWSEFTLDAAREPVNGVECVSLVSKDGDELQSLYLDPAREYLPVQYVERYTAKRNEFVRRRFDWEYARDPQHGWTLSSWKLADYTEAKVVKLAQTCTMLKQSLNAELSEADFNIQFPSGAEVTDADAGRTYTVLPNGRMLLTKIWPRDDGEQIETDGAELEESSESENAGRVE